MMMEINDFPAEILLKIFGHLPPEGLKIAVLVSQRWRKLGEEPGLWSWAVVTVNNKEDINKLSSRRLRQVQQIHVQQSPMDLETEDSDSEDGEWEAGDLEDGEWEAGDWEAFFQATLSLPSLKKICGLEGNDLSKAEQSLLARALTKLEEVDLTDTELTTEQITTILIQISQEDTNLKKLDLQGNDLSDVEPEVVARAVARLDDVDLEDTELSTAKMTSILTLLADIQTKTKRLNLEENYGFVVDVPAALAGVVRL